jgi:hypothetical protein
LPQREQTKAFKDLAGRQLLVAMLEATFGVRFEERITSEYKALSEVDQSLYAIASLATNRHLPLTLADLVFASGRHDPEVLAASVNLIRRGILVKDLVSDIVRTRHRRIAEVIVEYLHEEEELFDSLSGLTLLAATRVSQSKIGRRIWAKPLRQLINHDSVLKWLGLDRGRAFYDRFVNVLGDDPHYLLHRGSMEVEEGNLGYAENFLSQAKALAPNDRLIETEFGYLRMKQACQSPDAPDAREKYMEGRAILDGRIVLDGKIDSYPYHIIGSQGISWVHRASLSRIDKHGILEELRAKMDEAERYHPRNEEIKRLKRDVNYEYMRTVVP